DLDREALAERAQLVLAELLLLVRDVLALARLAEAVALHRAGEDDRGLTTVLHGRLVGRVDLDRIMSAQPELAQVVVAVVLDELQQARIAAEQVLADVRARLDGELLVLPVDDLAEAADQQAVGVAGEQRIPVAAPDALDDVPAGAAEDRLQFLDDLPVAAHRPVEPLQVAVDDEDQVVEPLARRERDRAERLGLVALAVAEERPDLPVPERLQAAVVQVA